MPNFEGVKLCNDSGVCATYKGVHKIEVKDTDEMLFENPGIIGSGGNSGFQSINLAAQFGARCILLFGFDYHNAAGVHWYGPNNGRGMRNPKDTHHTRWRKAIANQAAKLKTMGIAVYNCSPDTSITSFPRITYEEAMNVI